ncbi:glycosyltransferase 61 family protein [Roseovarius sp. 2305UL8-3]|uniref:glycosyltransferase 61 family protein n=1 Tax=Roseovarius conchicola TaxID=3121636 RepID=UPI003526FFA7
MTENIPPPTGETASLISPNQLPPPIVEPIADAVVMPVGPEAGIGCGVFRPDGSFCDLSRTRLSRSRFSAIPDHPGTTTRERLTGNYLFAGIGRHHFGHFIMETLSRLWALDGRQDRFDGLILLPMYQIDFGAVLRRRLLSFLRLMGCNMPLHLVRTPMTVDTLYLPAQGFGHMQWATGTGEFRSYVRDRIDRNCPAIGPEKIYVSRSKLKYSHQRVDQEARIEALMKSAGYAIFHPQRHSIRAQCQIYRAAHTIVGGDGSAFHLAPFAMQSETRVGLIQRRTRQDAVESMANQIKAFAPVDLVRLNPIKESATAANKDSAAPISFESLKEQLEAAHLI